MISYSTLLVIIWLSIFVICKNWIIVKIKKFSTCGQSNIKENKPVKYNNNLVKNIEHELNDIKNMLSTEVLFLKDDIYNFSSAPASLPLPWNEKAGKQRKLLEKSLNEPVVLNMYEIFFKSFNILKQFIQDLIKKFNIINIKLI